METVEESLLALCRHSNTSLVRTCIQSIIIYIVFHIIKEKFKKKEKKDNSFKINGILTNSKRQNKKILIIIKIN